MPTKTDKTPSRLGMDLKSRLTKMQPDLDDLLGEVTGAPPLADPAPTPKAKPAAPSTASTETVEVKESTAAKPLKLIEGKDAAEEKNPKPQKRPGPPPGELVRMPFNFRRDQLVSLEMLKARLYQESGKSIDKSTLAREAMDMLLEKYVQYLPES